MYENIKSTILTILVFLNVVLVWQLWTIQPDYALLEDPMYVENTTLGEVRKLSEIIEPEQIVFHLAEEKKTLLSSRESLFYDLYEQVLESELHSVTYSETIHLEGIQDEAMEIIFPAAVPVELLLKMLEDEEERVLPVNEINRLLVFANKEREEVKFRFISDREQAMFDAETSFPFHDFLSVYLAKVNELPSGFALDNEQGGLHQQNIYLPIERVVVDSISYTSTPILVNTFKQRLFNDPQSAKYFRQEDGESSYTDGNRMINISNNGNYMDYINPIYSEGQERSNKHVIDSSLEFINGHGGWTDNYVLANWRSSPLEDEVTYNLKINGIPVLQLEDSDEIGLYIARVGNQTSRYRRPLFDLDNQPIDAKRAVELPSGEEVVETLKQQDSFRFPSLEKIAVGYEMRKRNAIVSVEPYWFVLYDGVWQKISFNNDREEEQNGLE